MPELVDEPFREAPCDANPDMWFGGPDDSESRAKASQFRAAQKICRTNCPADIRRRCAAIALSTGENHGVWAGVKMPGGHPRSKNHLTEARRELAAIAAGTTIDSQELSEVG